MIRAVLLDAMGTLLELEQPAPLLVGELARRGVAISAGEARAAIVAEIAYYREHHDEASTLDLLDDLRARCTAVLREALPPHARELPGDELGAALLAALRFRPYPDVPDTLRALRSEGVRLVVVSNWDVSLHEQLATTGIAPLVDAAVSSAEVGASK
ncbi:MAG TPA: HAD family hydrolase, partial [Solirubrobacteraceae bacterium]|nr:HAD family hydrolase [Solirubrobacteraceae bacterium]